MTYRRTVRSFVRVAIVLGVTGTVAVGAWAVFVDYPASLVQLLGVLVAVPTVLAGLQLGSRLAGSVVPGYNVAEVAVEGTITRDRGGGTLPRSPTTPSADDVVDQIERADADRAVDALVLKLNTPGGEVVPSDDIRQAAVDFDGPTVAYATDLCASGGMWIASGCEELRVREGSLVGSVGVRFSQLRVHDFLAARGIEYERVVAGEYKDALSSLKPLEDDEREYLQSLADGWYETFVERVAEGTDMDREAVEATEAKVYLGERAVEVGLADALGDRDAVEAALEDRLGEPVTVSEFEPQRGLRERLGAGAAGLAYAVGAGIGTAVRAEGDGGLRMD
ncbi:S49 family peptidase [Halobacteriales archaeon Cl-PHB]